MNLPKYTYLYGYTKEDVKELNNMLYRDALINKIQAAKGLKERLLKGSYIDSDVTRVNEVHKAIQFNEMLLKELL